MNAQMRFQGCPWWKVLFTRLALVARFNPSTSTPVPGIISSGENHLKNMYGIL
jgi:predicted secreted protein